MPQNHHLFIRLCFLAERLVIPVSLESEMKLDYKCILKISSRHPPPLTYDYTINSERLSADDHHKDLGVIISSNLTWNKHLKYAKRIRRLASFTFILQYS